MLHLGWRLMSAAWVDEFDFGVGFLMGKLESETFCQFLAICMATPLFEMMQAKINTVIDYKMKRTNIENLKLK